MLILFIITTLLLLSLTGLEYARDLMMFQQNYTAPTAMAAG